MQQSAFEHAALIWTRPANTIRARGVMMAATEAGYMSAPDIAPNCSKTLLRKGRLYMCIKWPAAAGFVYSW